MSTEYPAWIIALPTASAAASAAEASGSSSPVTGREPVITAARALIAMSCWALGRNARRRITAPTSTPIAMNVEVTVGSRSAGDGVHSHTRASELAENPTPENPEAGNSDPRIRLVAVVEVDENAHKCPT
ncbi:hypothetical protein GCM10017690_06710 [Microbacterium terregens]